MDGRIKREIIIPIIGVVIFVILCAVVGMANAPTGKDVLYHFIKLSYFSGYLDGVIDERGRNHLTAKQIEDKSTGFAENIIQQITDYKSE